MKTLMLMITVALLFSYPITAQAQSANAITVSFENEDGAFTLNWNTKREVNTSYFITEKSTDGVHYTAFATKKAGSSSVFPRSYQTDDIPETDSVIYYRVVLVLMNGERILSNPVVYRFKGVNDNEQHIAKQ